MKKKVEANPCLGHDCYDPDLGCTIPSIDHWFACPLMPDPGPEEFDGPGECRPPKNLTYDNAQACCVAYDPPPPGTARQLQRLAAEGRPGACLGCGFENACAARGCALLRSVSKIVALIERK